MKELEYCKNMFGELDIDIKNRIKKYIKNPNFENWDDIQSIIISKSTGRISTIWQFILEVDNTFPKVGRRTDTKGKILREWEKIPTPEQVKKALIYATH